MKKRRIVPWMLSVLMMVLLFAPLTTRAAESSENGIPVSLTTDQKTYGKQETIHAKFTVKDKKDTNLKDWKIKFQELDGYKIKYNTDLSTLKSGDKITVKADYVPEGTTHPFGIKTGDQSKRFLFLVAGLIALCVIFCVVKKKNKNNKYNKQLMAWLLVLTMSVGLIPANTVKAQDTVKKSSIMQKIKVDGKEKEIAVRYQYKTEESDKAAASDQKNITVKFDSAGGSTVEKQTIPAGSLLKEPKAPTKKGYVFAGWFLDKEHKLSYDFTSYVPQQDGYLYAYWINPDDTTDTDGDGLLDKYEELMGTDPNKKDTDGDGLPDAYEVEALGLSPLLEDTDGNGIKDGEEDSDKDGLTNLEEYKLGTKPGCVDTDNDGLSDGDEVHKYKTDPLKADTDGDGVSDGKEIEMGTDPLTAQSTFDTEASAKGEGKIKDVKVSVTLPGSQVESLDVQPDDTGLFPENMPGYIGKAYDFSIDGKLPSEATLTFQIDKTLLEDPSFEPVIYYYNVEKSELEPLETTVDRNTGIATAVTPHFSTYILLNKTDFDKVWTTDIRKPSEDTAKGLTAAFVLDRSQSMDDNDPEDLRLKLTKEYIQKMEKGRDAGSLVTFIRNAELVTPLTDDLDALIQDVDSIQNDDGRGFWSGTNGYAGISQGLSQLKKDTSGNDKVMLFMTDGEDTVTGNKYEKLIEDAKNNHIIIYTIGLGYANEDLLKSIAEGTGGKYYYASSSEDLNGIFKDTEIETIGSSKDSNNDGISDYYTKQLCKAGPYVNGTRNPFSGLSYEKIQANADYDGDGLKNGEELKIEARDTDVYAHLVLLSDPTKKDSDNDGLYDNAARVSKGSEIAPKDPHPLVYDGAKNMWKEHIAAQINSGTKATDKNKPLATEYKKGAISLAGELPGALKPLYQFVEKASVVINDELLKSNFPGSNAAKEIRNIVLFVKKWTTVQSIENVRKEELYKNASKKMKTILGDKLANTIIKNLEHVYTNDLAYAQAILGGKLLNFIPDEYNAALHSQPHTWQRAFGYTDFYDLVFAIGSNAIPYKMYTKNRNYIIWLWKGDYWNLGSGTEIGIYKYNAGVTGNSQTEVYDAIDYEVPMSVSLYNYSNGTVKDNIFNWNPSVSQWWGTGFNWRYPTPDPHQMVTVGCVDLSGHSEIYDNIEDGKIANNLYVIRDSKKKVWIQWIG